MESMDYLWIIYGIYGLSMDYLLHFTSLHSLPDSGFSIVFLDAGAGIKRWLKLTFTHNINL